MAEVVNLNRFRKARRRAEETKTAEENRVRFGRGKAEKSKDALDTKRALNDLDGKKIE